MGLPQTNFRRRGEQDLRVRGLHGAHYTAAAREGKDSRRPARLAGGESPAPGATTVVTGVEGGGPPRGRSRTRQTEVAKLPSPAGVTLALCSNSPAGGGLFQLLVRPDSGYCQRLISQLVKEGLVPTQRSQNHRSRLWNPRYR